MCEDIPEFRFRIVTYFKDALSRQVAVSVRIDSRTNLLNRLPRS